MSDPVVSTAALAVVVVVLATGAFSKLRALRDFAAAVAAYRIIPVGAASAFAVSFAVVELAACGLLLAPASRLIGGMVALAIVVVASAGVIVNLWRGRTDIRCGCGGLARATLGTGGLSWWLIARNGALLALVVVAALGSGPWGPAINGVTDAVTFCGATVVALMLYASTSQLVSNHVTMRRRES